jgi:hypothetical protein
MICDSNISRGPSATDRPPAHIQRPSAGRAAAASSAQSDEVRVDDFRALTMRVSPVQTSNPGPAQRVGVHANERQSQTPALRWARMENAANSK